MFHENHEIGLFTMDFGHFLTNPQSDLTKRHLFRSFRRQARRFEARRPCAARPPASTTVWLRQSFHCPVVWEQDAPQALNIWDAARKSHVAWLGNPWKS